MELIPKAVLAETKENRDIELRNDQMLRELGDVSPAVINIMETATKAAYPLAVAANSVKHHIDRMRGTPEYNPRIGGV